VNTYFSSTAMGYGDGSNHNLDVAIVCMQQFVAMFVGGGVGGRSRDACTAYLTRSTRGVRQVLLEHVRVG
jgi:hypothetical protein